MSQTFKITYEFHSSDIIQCEYNVIRKELEVLFQNNWRYVYYNVPLDLILNWPIADSVGSYFNSEIKRRHFKYERVA